jgi:hypothetical protein
MKTPKQMTIVYWILNKIEYVVLAFAKPALTGLEQKAVNLKRNKIIWMTPYECSCFQCMNLFSFKIYYIWFKIYNWHPDANVKIRIKIELNNNSVYNTL